MKINSGSGRKPNYARRAKVVKVALMVIDAVAVNLAYFLALVLRYYVTFEFNPNVTMLDAVPMCLRPNTVLSVWRLGWMI